MKAFWEILVPTERRVTESRMTEMREHAQVGIEVIHPGYYSTRYHRVWDEKVRAITGGLTIMSPIKGQWVSPDGELFRERMIPVRIVATREQIDRIIDMTLVYYDQLMVLCYKISDEVIFKNRSDTC
jgi:hypothetical protein